MFLEQNIKSGSIRSMCEYLLFLTWNSLQALFLCGVVAPCYYGWEQGATTPHKKVELLD